MNLLHALSPRESAVAACARALKESILKGELEAGSSLPPERELAATFGVNRLTLRSALSQLGAAGLIAVRHGSGNVVRDFAQDGGPDLLPTLVALARDGKQWREVIADMLAVRRALAGAALERLVRNKEPKALKALEAAVEQFALEAERPGATADTLAAADQVMIRTLLKQTSVVLALTANPIFRVLEQLPELRAAMFAQPAFNVAGYRLLIAGLKKRDPQTAQQVLEALAVMDEALLERLSTRRTHRCPPESSSPFAPSTRCWCSTSSSRPSRTSSRRS